MKILCLTVSFIENSLGSLGEKHQCYADHEHISPSLGTSGEK